MGNEHPVRVHGQQALQADVVDLLSVLGRCHPKAQFHQQAAGKGGLGMHVERILARGAEHGALSLGDDPGNGFHLGLQLADPFLHRLRPAHRVGDGLRLGQQLGVGAVARVQQQHGGNLAQLAVDRAMPAGVGDDQVGLQPGDDLHAGLRARAHRGPWLDQAAHRLLDPVGLSVIGNAHRRDAHIGQCIDEGILQCHDAGGRRLDRQLALVVMDGDGPCGTRRRQTGSQAQGGHPGQAIASGRGHGGTLQRDPEGIDGLIR